MIRNIVEVAGTLLAPDKTIIANARLEFTPINPKGITVITTADDKGEYNVQLRAGTYKLEIIDVKANGCGAARSVELLERLYIAINNRTPSPCDIEHLVTDKNACKMGGALEKEHLENIKDDIELIHNEIMSKDIVKDVPCNADKGAIYGRKGDRSGWEKIGRGTVLDTAETEPQVRVAGGWKSGDEFFTPKVDTKQDGRFLMAVKNGVPNWDVFYPISWGDITGELDRSRHWTPIADAIGIEVKKISAWVQNNFATKAANQASAAHAKVADVAKSLDTAGSKALIDLARQDVVFSVNGVKPDGAGNIRLTWQDMTGDPRLSASFHIVQDEIKSALANAAAKAKNDFSLAFLGINAKAKSAAVADSAAEARSVEATARNLIISDARTGLVKSVNKQKPDGSGNVQINLPVVEVAEAPDQDVYVRTKGQWIKSDDIYQRKSNAIDNAKSADIAKGIVKQAKDEIVAEARKGSVKTIVVNGVAGTVDKNGGVVIRTPIDTDVVDTKPYVRIPGAWGELKAGNGIKIKQDGDDFEIESVNLGSITSGVNVGNGEAILQAIDGGKMEFRSIHGEGDLLVEDDGDSIKISYTGAGSSGGIPDVKTVGVFVRSQDGAGVHRWIDASTLFAKKGEKVKNADYAQNATHAMKADNAKAALKADSATVADSAKSAATAAEADLATRAKEADKAAIADGLTPTVISNLESKFIDDAPDLANYVRRHGAWIPANFLPMGGKAESAKQADNSSLLGGISKDDIITNARLGAIRSINTNIKPDSSGNVNFPIGISDVPGKGIYVRSKGGWSVADYLPRLGKAESAKIADKIPQGEMDKIIQDAQKGVVRTVNGLTPVNGNVDITGTGGGGINDAVDSGMYVRTKGNWIDADARYLKTTDQVANLSPTAIAKVVGEAIRKAPVTSVNGQLGNVNLSASDVKAAPELKNGLAGEQYALSADGQSWERIKHPNAIKPGMFVSTSEINEQAIESPLKTPKLVLARTSIASSDAWIENDAEGLNLVVDSSSTTGKKITFATSGNAGADNDAVTIEFDKNGDFDMWFDSARHKPTHGNDSVLTLGSALNKGFFVDSVSKLAPNKTFSIKNGTLIESAEFKEPTRDGLFVRSVRGGAASWINIKDKFVNKSSLDSEVRRLQHGLIRSINGNYPDATGNIIISGEAGKGGGVTVAGIRDVEKDQTKPHARIAGQWVLLPESISREDALNLFLTKQDRYGIIQDAKKGQLTLTDLKGRFLEPGALDFKLDKPTKVPDGYKLALIKKGNAFSWLPLSAVEAVNGVSGRVTIAAPDQSFELKGLGSAGSLLAAKVLHAPKIVDDQGVDAVTVTDADVKIHGNRFLSMNDVDMMKVSNDGSIQIGHKDHSLNLWGKGELYYNGQPIGSGGGGVVTGGSAEWSQIRNKPDNLTTDDETIKKGAFFRCYDPKTQAFEWTNTLDLGLLD